MHQVRSHAPAVAIGLGSALLWTLAASVPTLHLVALAALVPWLALLYTTPSRLQAVLSGVALGIGYYAYSLYPLVSAVDWTGWMVVSLEELAAIRRQQSFFLHGLWLMLALLGGVLWGTLGAVTHWVAQSSPPSPWRFALVFSSVWLALCEGLRLAITWGFHWDFLGNTLVVNDVLRQVSALGGIRAMTLVVLAANLAVFATYRWIVAKDRAWAGVAISGTAIFLAALGFGTLQIASEPHGQPIEVTAVQHSKEAYTSRDFANIGIDRSFLQMLELQVDKDRDLVVLPETISFGALSVDGTRSAAFPEKPLAPADSWTAILSRALRGRESLVAIGVETVRNQKQYNSMGLWNKDQVLGWYSKRRLVPFAEYFPKILGRFSAQGKSRFSAGTEAVVWDQGPLQIGVFICQEVLFPYITRDLALAGSNLLISGGNDGVFSNPRVATLQARLAQLRSTETGRGMIRAMKTGRSAIIDSRGREVVASKGKEPEILNGTLHLSNELTAFVRFGDWVLGLAYLGCLVMAVDGWRRMRRKRSQSPKTG